MKLYYYEHCPYCIRVLLLTLYKKINIEHTVLANDDEKTPIKMIGKKMVPILKKDDESYMPESLDIIQYLDNLDTPILGNDNLLKTDIQILLDKMSTAYSQLVLPRSPQPIFEEFKTASARAYFTKKKEQMVGSFNACLEKTSSLINEISPLLEEISHHLPQESSTLTYQDIHLYPKIYLLQLVNELVLPSKMQKYLAVTNQQLDDKNHYLKLNHQ